MPLLDHFHAPIPSSLQWNSFHSNWATRIADALNDKWLPEGFLATENTRSALRLEIDVATFDERGDVTGRNGTTLGTTAAPAWSPPAPARAVPVVFADEFEVRVEMPDERRLVAAIELVSSANKDRPDERAAFTAKCAGYLLNGVSVIIVDVVTTRRGNLHTDLLQLLDAPVGPDLPNDSFQYAVSYRPVARGERTELDLWPAACYVGQPLPTMPLHLTQDLFVPVDLEATYMEACRKRRLK